MAKFILSIVVLGVLVAVATANPPKKECEPTCEKDVKHPIVCTRIQGSRKCRLQVACDVARVNCLRARDGKRGWQRVQSSMCRGLQPGRTGTCRVSTPRPRPCMRCDKDDHEKKRCYRSNDNKCRRRTTCDAKRQRCMNPKSTWRAVDDRQCRGIQGSQVRKCRTHSDKDD